MMPLTPTEFQTRAQLVGRPQQLFGTISQFQSRLRPTPDERVDLPEIQESFRVSFSNGVRVPPTQADPLPSSAGLAMYRQMAALNASDPGNPP